MSQVVYRGVAYDTEQRRQAQQQQEPQQYNETYRGIKFVKEAKWCRNSIFFNLLKSKNKEKSVVIKHLFAVQVIAL